MSGNNKRTIGTVLAAFVGAIVIAGAVYGIVGPYGNDPSAAECDATRAVAERMSGLNTGQVAAFQIADTPVFVGDLTFTDGEGQATGLADHRGTTVLLNLWATWCAPCREEMPALARLQERLGGERFRVLPVSMDSGDAEKPKRFYSEESLDGALPFRHDGTLSTFNRLKKQNIAFGMPTTVLVDDNGCAAGWMNGPADWGSDDAFALVEAALGSAD